MPHAKVVMPFGEHHGKPLAAIPRGYLRWFVENIEGCASLKRKISQHLRKRKTKRRRKRSRRNGSTTVVTNATADFRADAGSEAPF